MKKFCFYSLVVIGIIFTSPKTLRAHEVVHDLFDVTIDINQKVYPVKLVLDSENYQLIKLVMKDKVIEGQDFLRSVLQGLPLHQSHGIDIAFLRSADFGLEEGGVVELSYINNVIFRKYKSQKFVLKRDGDQWNFYALAEGDDEGENSLRSNPLKRVLVTTLKFWGLPLGVEKLDFEY